MPKQIILILFKSIFFVRFIKVFAVSGEYIIIFLILLFLIASILSLDKFLIGMVSYIIMRSDFNLAVLKPATGLCAIFFLL